MIIIWYVFVSVSILGVLAMGAGFIVSLAKDFGFLGGRSAA